MRDAFILPTTVGNLRPGDLSEFQWVNAPPDNLKTTRAGAFHALQYRRYGEHYLAAFAYRFNRRFDLRSLDAGLIVEVMRERQIKEKASEFMLGHVSNQKIFLIFRTEI